MSEQVEVSMRTVEVAWEELERLIRETDGQKPDPLTDSVFQARDELREGVERAEQAEAGEVEERMIEDEEVRGEFVRRLKTETNCLKVEDCLTGELLLYTSKSRTTGWGLFRLAEEHGYNVWLTSVDDGKAVVEFIHDEVLARRLVP